MRRFARRNTTRGDKVQLGTSLCHRSRRSERRCRDRAHCLSPSVWGAAATGVSCNVRQCAHHITIHAKGKHRDGHDTDTPRAVCSVVVCGVHATRHTPGPALVCRSRSLVISVVTTSMTMMASSQALYSQYDTTFANILEKASAEAPYCIEGFWDV